MMDNQERATCHIREGNAISGYLLAFKWQGKIPEFPYCVRNILSFAKTALSRRGIDRRLHFAYLRAMITARRMIDESIR
jgi:hypothetical protein